MTQSFIDLLSFGIARMEEELEAARRLRDLMSNGQPAKAKTQKKAPAKVTKPANSARSIAQRKRWAEQKRLQREAAKAEKAKAAKK
jgi:hypothetical protein